MPLKILFLVYWRGKINFYDINGQYIMSGLLMTSLILKSKYKTISCVAKTEKSIKQKQKKKNSTELNKIVIFILF